MTSAAKQGLRVSGNRRYLIREDGSPFFWLGDTAWELFHRLNREEADRYLRTRAEQGFTVIQAVALAELEGLTVPNAHGRYPLQKNSSGHYDPKRPDLSTSDSDYTYWDHVDYIIERAASLGLYIALLPTWGDKYNQLWGKGPEIFDEPNAYDYGLWLGQRYRDYPNVVWVLGGDRPLTRLQHFCVVKAMAQGLRIGDAGRHLCTFHPMGGYSSSHHVHDQDWLDFNMIQSGHSSLNNPNYEKVASDYALQPVKPTLDAEPRYEDHPIGFKPENGYFDDFDVRQAAYWAVFAGGFGHTYGHHCVWSMNKESTSYFPLTWEQALQRPGAGQLKLLRRLIEARPFLSRVPDQDLLAENYPGASHLQACRGDGYALIYTPNGLAIKVNMGRISGEQVRVSWYNPRTGAVQEQGDYPNHGQQVFSPPSAGRGQDWVLVLDDAAAGFTTPGQLPE